MQNINVVVWRVNARLDPDLSFKLGGSHVISWWISAPALDEDDENNEAVRP